MLSYCVGKESQLSFVPIIIIIILKKTEKERRKRPNTSVSHVACTHSQKAFYAESSVSGDSLDVTVSSGPDQTRERESM